MRWRLKSPASQLFTQPFIQAQIKETIKLHVTGLCVGNSSVTGEFPTQTLIPSWISNHMSSKVWGEITYPFPNFNGYIVEVS